MKVKYQKELRMSKFTGIFFEGMIIGHDGERGSSQGKGVVLESKTQ